MKIGRNVFRNSRPGWFSSPASGRTRALTPKTSYRTLLFVSGDASTRSESRSFFATVCAPSVSDLLRHDVRLYSTLTHAVLRKAIGQSSRNSAMRTEIAAQPWPKPWIAFPQEQRRGRGHENLERAPPFRKSGPCSGIFAKTRRLRVIAIT